jgi:hypothetical protein
MNQNLRACFTLGLGLILLGGPRKLCQGATAEPLELNRQDLAITVHVFNLLESHEMNSPRRSERRRTS